MVDRRPGDLRPAPAPPRRGWQALDLLGDGEDDQEASPGTVARALAELQTRAATLKVLPGGKDAGWGRVRTQAEPVGAERLRAERDRRLDAANRAQARAQEVLARTSTA